MCLFLTEHPFNSPAFEIPGGAKAVSLILLVGSSTIWYFTAGSVYVVATRAHNGNICSVSFIPGSMKISFSYRYQ